MLRLILRGVGHFLFYFSCSFHPVLPRIRQGMLIKTPKRRPDATSATSSDTTAPSDPAKLDESATSEEATPALPAPAAQKASSDKKGTNDDYKPAPIFTPMLATTGTLGLFTVETGDTLPKAGFAFSAFGNKFGRMPGSVTILEIGLDRQLWRDGPLERLRCFRSLRARAHRKWRPVESGRFPRILERRL